MQNFCGSGGERGGRWVGGSAAGVPRSERSSAYKPHNDPHDALIILNIHRWDEHFLRKNLPITSGSHQPTSHPEVRSGFKKLSAFWNSPQILSILRIDTWGEKKTLRKGKKRFSAPLAPTHSPKFSNWSKTGWKTLGGSGGWGGGGGWAMDFQQAVPFGQNGLDHCNRHPRKPQDPPLECLRCPTRPPEP